ncbi:MAG: B12-binding domain-containing radical SAM protein [Candidatus Omnitrophota bacterium]|nr:MAG: B12-binding domain-containing radical SAM protein [Candidatus Omnitrophota bacterium]
MKTTDLIKDVLLVYLSQEHSDYLISERLDYGMKRVPKLGFMYLAAVLGEKGVHAHIMDQELQPFTFEDLAGRLQKEKFGFIGFYSTTAIKSKLLRYIKRLRLSNIDIPIIVGGPGYFAAQEYLEAGCDIVCRGEGEITICEIVNYFNGVTRDIEEVKGIYYRKDGQMKTTQAQDLIQNLDTLPFPRRDSTFKEGKFYDFHIFNMRTPYTTMVTSRGCPHRCTYCSSHNVWENKVRLRSPENVIAEIEYCVKEFGLRYIGFRDDMFGMDKKWLERFSELAVRLKHRVLWSAMVHPFSFRGNRVEAMRLLKDAGCDMLIFGLQSAHPEILKNIRRSPQEPDELAETVKLAKKNNISTVIEFIFGLPGETEETMSTSIDYILKVKPHYAQFNVLSVLEGSRIEEEFRNRRICKFSNSEIKKWCARASRHFYSNPALVFQDFAHVLSKNPLWFFRIAGHSLYLLKYLGFKKNKIKR